MSKNTSRAQKLKERIVNEVKEILDSDNLIVAKERLSDYLSLASFVNSYTDCVIELKKEIDIRFRAITESYVSGPIVLEGNQAVVLYLYALSMYDFFMEEGAFFLLGEIISHMLTTIEESNGTRLSKKDIEETFNMIEERFKIQSEILGKDKLLIGAFDNSLKNLNGIYTYRFLPDHTCEHFIFIPQEIPGFGCPQKITLIHEIGHLLHTCLTRQPFKTPESFEVIKSSMFPVIKDATPMQEADVFADCFMIAITNGTDLEQFRPLPYIGQKNKDILESYFNDLIINTQ